jgi:hypothetical protein
MAGSRGVPGFTLHDAVWIHPKPVVHSGNRLLDHQQLPQMPGISAIALRALLRTPQPSSLRRLGQMHTRTDPAQLLDHEPRAGRRLQCDLELPAVKTRQELPHRSAIRRHHTRALHLAGLSVDPLAGDLSSMLVKSHDDAHWGPPQAPRFERLRGHTPRLS